MPSCTNSLASCLHLMAIQVRSLTTVENRFISITKGNGNQSIFSDVAANPPRTNQVLMDASLLTNATLEGG